ncbi:hypothetical protein ONZ45_g17655 [Pleurotus djamor]|nr:hypothetical protein ONZ45_g17655 [Pleurotus djamor]
MGRKRLYHTDSERAAANRAKHQRYYERHREAILERERVSYQQAHSKRKGVLKHQVGKGSGRRLQCHTEIVPDVLSTAEKKLKDLKQQLLALFVPTEFQFFDQLCLRVLNTDNGSDELEQILENLSEHQDAVTSTLNELVQTTGIGPCWQGGDALLTRSRVVTACIEDIYCHLLEGSLSSARTALSLMYQPR